MIEEYLHPSLKGGTMILILYIRGELLNQEDGSIRWLTINLVEVFTVYSPYKKCRIWWCYICRVNRISFVQKPSVDTLPSITDPIQVSTKVIGRGDFLVAYEGYQSKISIKEYTKQWTDSNQENSHHSRNAFTRTRSKNKHSFTSSKYTQNSLYLFLR